MHTEKGRTRLFRLDVDKGTKIDVWSVALACPNCLNQMLCRVSTCAAVHQERDLTFEVGHLLTAESRKLFHIIPFDCITSSGASSRNTNNQRFA